MTINVVSYTISGPSSFSKTGTIDVSHSSTVSTTIGALPAGSGFAVTLMIGIVASLFTAVFFTRLIFDLVYKGRRRLQTLSI